MTPDRLTASQILLLVIYATGMTGGQFLFKMAALRYGNTGVSERSLFHLLWNGYFALAAMLYAGYAVFWVWILTFVPLSRAYPFVALAFAMTSLLGALLFGELITIRLVTGVVLVLFGLLLIST